MYLNDFTLFKVLQKIILQNWLPISLTIQSTQKVINQDIAVVSAN